MFLWRRTSQATPAGSCGCAPWLAAAYRRASFNLRTDRGADSLRCGWCAVAGGGRAVCGVGDRQPRRQALERVTRAGPVGVAAPEPPRCRDGMQVALASRRFPTARGDEDFIATEEVVVVPDGATVPPGLATGCIPRNLMVRQAARRTAVRTGDRRGGTPLPIASHRRSPRLPASTGVPATRCLFPEPAP